MRSIGILLICVCLLGCSNKAMEKINGLSFVAAREEVRLEHIKPVLRVHANFAAVMPFGFIRDKESPEIIFDTERQWYGETIKGAEQYINTLHKNGVRVMLKPQLWIARGQFTGTLAMKTEADWKALEASYSKFILSNAELAERTGTEIFCIGTELQLFVQHRPQYWESLIKGIRKRYKGKLTYAANWNEYSETPFWESLDFIGIDAYFPLSEAKTPDVSSLRKQWQPHKKQIETLAKITDRQVLFTEYGYRSTDYAAEKPWHTDHKEAAVNLEGQVNAITAIFQEFWQEDWFAGGFLWKWFIAHDRVGGPTDNRFTPQNKPAEKLIQEYYKAY